jgi:protein-S-isoprenylcysteine O-methyltransferase Ste14
MEYLEEGNVTDAPLYAYLVLLAIYKLAEHLAMRKTGTLAHKPRWEWTMAAIIVPYYLVIVGPLLEYFYFRWEGGYLSWILGTVFYAAATFFRTKGHLDLQKGFSMAIEKIEEVRLVQTGLYRYIRHPLYLGNLCLFVACPLFLAARISWAFTVLGCAGVLVRIRVEERFLREHLEGYRAYIDKTWALIPGLY